MTDFTDTFTMEALICCEDHVRIVGPALEQFIEQNGLARRYFGLFGPLSDYALIAWNLEGHPQGLHYALGRSWEVRSSHDARR